MERVYDQHPELKGRVYYLEYHINAPGNGSEEPMYHTTPLLSEMFSSPPFDTAAMAWHGRASASYYLNRSRPVVEPGDTTDSYVEKVFRSVRLDQEALAEVSVQSSWESESKTVAGTVSVRFDTAADPGDYRLGIFVSEDSICEPGNPNYRQWSDFAPKPDFWVDDYCFNSVVRGEILTENSSIWGKPGTIPAQPEKGVIYSASFRYTLPEKFYDRKPFPENISLIGFAIRVPSARPAAPYSNNTIPECILNCVGVPLTQNPTGIIGKSIKRRELGLVPCSGGFSCTAPSSAELAIFSLQGRKLFSRKLAAGETYTHRFTAQSMVVVQITDSEGVKVQRFFPE